MLRVFQIEQRASSLIATGQVKQPVLEWDDTNSSPSQRTSFPDKLEPKAELHRSPGSAQ